MTWWIPLIFAVGLGISLLGLSASIAESRSRDALTPGVWVFGLFVVFFAWPVLGWLFYPYLQKPRIVPYFQRQLAEHGGGTTAAFKRGRGLYLEAAALDALAAHLGVKPLTAFGFAYDYYDQPVVWHSAAEGLTTVQALLPAAVSHSTPMRAAISDLEALASALAVAAVQGVEFSLVLRLHARDSLQAVMTREVRQGSFW